MPVCHAPFFAGLTVAYRGLPGAFPRPRERGVPLDHEQLAANVSGGLAQPPVRGGRIMSLVHERVLMMRRFMMRRAIALLFLLTLIAGCQSPGDGGARRGDGEGDRAGAARPNIVFIVADDMGYGDLGVTGAEDTHTPYLDKLASEGVLFTRFYANAPECTPTRTAIFTGRYQQRVGGLECAIGTDDVGRYGDAIRLAEQGELGLPTSEFTLVEGLKNAGYETIMSGKWHLGYRPQFSPNAHGFDHAFYIEGGNCDYYRHTESTGRNVLRLNGELIEREGYMTDLITNEAVVYLAKKQNDKPFFLYVPYTAPHSPFQVPLADSGRLVPEAMWNEGTRAQYVQMVNRMDEGIGLILNTLRAKGFADNTLVVFISDHGGTKHQARNEPFFGHKGTLFEGGLRVPCIARWPGKLPAGKTTDRMGMTFDLTRSFFRIAGVDVPDGRKLDGIDILKDVQTDSPPRDRTLFWRYRRADRTWKAVRDGRWKYVLRESDAGYDEWLFDFDADEREQVNIMGKENEVLKRLEGLIRDWEKEVTAAR